MSVTLFAVGDIVLDEPDPGSFFDPSRSLLTSADAVIGHVEVPHSDTLTQVSTDVPAPPARPDALDALPKAGFSAVTLAGNHVYDAGDVGLTDTVKHARERGLATAGAGASLGEARAPATVDVDGVSVAVLSYNCVGPRESWATSTKPGCAYINILTHYELDHASPGGPPRIYTFAEPQHLTWLAEDIAAARRKSDLVIVSFHKGIGHTPAALGMYEGPVARAAIDAGADAVLGHHAHILRGVEMHRGKPIFHGLGNFVTVTRALTPVGNDSPERQEWARRRQELYGFVPDPDMPYYPFHPESRNTFVAALTRLDDGEVRPGLVPCWIDGDARPVPLSRDEGGQQVVEYIQDITSRAGLSTQFFWRDGTVVGVRADGSAGGVSGGDTPTT